MKIIQLIILPLLMISQSLAVQAQTYLIGPENPLVGAYGPFYHDHHTLLFDVMHTDGIYIDSVTIYPTSHVPGKAYAIVVKDTANHVIDSYSGITTATNSQPERVPVDLFVPQGTGYSLGLSGNPGMIRNLYGASYPYTIPEVIEFTGSTHLPFYWYFFYNIRVTLPADPTDAGLSRLIAPQDTICAGETPIEVMLKNYGPEELIMVDIHTRINGAQQPVYKWLGFLQPGDSVKVTPMTYNFDMAALPYEIIVYTCSPNRYQDSSNTNDTVNKEAVNVIPALVGKINPEGTAKLCGGDSLMAYIEAQKADTFQWYKDGYPINGAHDTLLYITSEGKYTVEFGDGRCTSMSDPVPVVAAETPHGKVNTLSSTTFCDGGNVIMDAYQIPGYTYQWYRNDSVMDGETNYQLDVNISGTYHVLVTSMHNCSTRSMDIPVNVKPVHQVNLGPDTTIYYGQKVVLDAGYGADRYLWSTGDTTQTITVDSTVMGFGSRQFFLTANLGMCKTTDSVKVTHRPCTTIVPEQKQTFLNVYPNPSQGQFTLQTPRDFSPEILVNIFDMSGKLLYQNTFPVGTGCREHQINTDLPQGVYYLQVKTQEKSQYQIIIIATEP